MFYRQKALLESKRILVKEGWFACMWNHRDLEDPIQKEIETIIKKHISGYGYGTRREDQRKEIEKSNFFHKIVHLNSVVQHSQSIRGVFRGMEIPRYIGKTGWQ